MSDATIHFDFHAGTGTTVMLIHGMACDGSDRAAQVQHFKDAGRAVATVDLRGHGQSSDFGDGDYSMTSMGADVANVLRHIGVGEAIVAGHSMGCRVATEAALHAPDIVKGVALVDGSRQAQGDVETAVSAVREYVEGRGFRTHMGGLFKSMFIPGTDQALVDRLVARALDRPEDRGLAVMLAMMRWDAGQFDARYGALTVPVEVIQSSHVDAERKRVRMTSDLVIEWHQQLSALVNDVVFNRLPDCGHFTMFDDPAGVNRCLDNLLGRIER